MKGLGPTVPTIESANATATAPAKIETGETGIGAGIARKSTRIMEFIMGAEKEMLACCEDAETLIEKCRKTKDLKTCQQASREMALCMHYQQESYDW
ncbi:hypothetical protein IV203_037690 [Nitzschia inconspicua]|uniref:Uncharacterized protein n=1 Tax=Nitzschia inconspicua TaxID=303405 RepID=A0A9K3LMM3_9STRA|nr:hypothetical protein IV203_037690 [Nitzschia inconspicua]